MSCLSSDSDLLNAILFTGLTLRGRIPSFMLVLRWNPPHPVYRFNPQVGHQFNYTILSKVRDTTTKENKRLNERVLTKSIPKLSVAALYIIKSYYNFGKALENSYDHYKKNNPKRTAQALVNKEVREQHPGSVSDDLLRKKKEWALKIYNLFSEIVCEIIFTAPL
ncbi:8709_t:CDS:2 [Rhizophagus irregularis]|nr:8709_t:CDS:2 [Rhizophagus irregularis]